MSQVSYGTITITDTNDIEQIYMVYAGSESNVTPPDVSDFALWKTDVTQTSGTYIWQRTVVKKSGIEITAMNFQQFYGEPVCVTGDGGRSIKSITTYYCNYGTGTPEENYSGWNIDTPEYDEDKPNYWVKTVIIYVDDSEEEFELNGDIVTFEDGEHKHLTSFTATINPKQDLHGYDKPWVGGAGKNKLDESTFTSDGTCTESNGVFSNASTDPRSYFSAVVRGYHSDNTFEDMSITPFSATGRRAFPTFTPQADIVRIAILHSGSQLNLECYFDCQLKSGQTYNASLNIIGFDPQTVGGLSFDKIQIETGSTATAYEPYSNICPISGWDSVNATRSGKNLLDASTAEIGTAWNGSRNSARARLVIPLKPNTDYVLTMNGTMSVDGVFRTFSTAIPSPTAPSAVTFPYLFNSGDNIYLTLGFNKTAIAQNDIDALNLMLEFGTTATAYEPYQADTYTTDLPETVYGGSLDVVNGVLTVDRAMVDLGTATWYYASAQDCFYTYKVREYTKQSPNLVCSNYPYVGIYADLVDKSCGYIYGNAICIRDSSFNQDTSAFKTAMSGVQLCYELATPQTYQLTPKQVTTLLGENNVWSDSGDVEISGFTIVGQDVQIHLDTALTDSIAKSVEANANASEALEKANEAESIAAHANEDSQGALSIATGINQHFFSIPNDYSTSVPAGSYITEINVDEFKRSPSGGNLLTRSDGVWLRNGADILASLTGSALKFYDGNGNNNSNIIASFGAEIILGKQQSKRINLNSTSFEMIGLNNVSESSYFSIKDLRNEDDEIILNYVGDGIQTVFKVHDNSLIDLASIIEVEINNVYVDNWSIGDDYKTIVFTSPPSNNAEIKVHFTITDDQWCKAFTFGQRAVIEGGNKGMGLNSIALGRLCEASAYSSISMGEATVASGANAIAMGYMTQAKEPFSIAMGYHTITSCSRQLVIGKFNNHLQNTDACFVIGNGTSNNDRSNLFVIDGNGNLKIKDGFKIINDSNNYIQLSSFGMDIFKKRESNFYKVASFSDTVRIGEENGFHLIVADSTIEFKNGNETLSYLALDKFFFINGEVSSSLFFSKYSLREGKDGKFIIGRR